MNGVDFIIPVNKEDLLQGASRQYVVEETYSKHELPGKLRGVLFVFINRM